MRQLLFNFIRSEEKLFVYYRSTLGIIFTERGGRMSKRKEGQKNDPKLAPGIDDQEELEQSASEEEIESGEYTSVTTLSYDEVEPS